MTQFASAPYGSFRHLLEGIGREEIKITDIRTVPLTFRPPDGSYVHECGPIVITKVDMSVVQVYTDQGLVGIGPGPNRPVNGVIPLGDKPGFGMELIDDLEQKFPYIPGPGLYANPRFPHAWERARAREERVRQRYRQTR